MDPSFGYAERMKQQEEELALCRQGLRWAPVRPWPAAGVHLYDRLVQRPTSGAWYDGPLGGMEEARAECDRRNKEYAAQRLRDGLILEPMTAKGMLMTTLTDDRIDRLQALLDERKAALGERTVAQIRRDDLAKKLAAAEADLALAARRDAEATAAIDRLFAGAGKAQGNGEAGLPVPVPSDAPAEKTKEYVRRPRRKRTSPAPEDLAAMKPPTTPLALPAHEIAGGYAFLDPGDVAVAATAGIPASFPRGDLDRVKERLKAASGGARELIVYRVAPSPLVSAPLAAAAAPAALHLVIRCDADGWCRPAPGQALPDGAPCFGLAALPGKLRELADAGVMVDLLPAADCDEAALLRVRELAIESGSRGVCVLPPIGEGQPSLFETADEAAAEAAEGNVP